MLATMKARIIVDWIAGQGYVWSAGEIVELDVFGAYGEALVDDGAIELVEPILRPSDPPNGDTARLL